MTKRKFTYATLVVVLVAAALSYFVKYAPDITPMVDPSYETSSPELQTDPNHQFAQKVLTSNIAMILVHSDFSDTNSVALDALRTWAKERFSEDNQYLHPVSIRQSEHHNTVLSSFFFNLVGPERSLLERSIKEFLRWRIDEFHDTDSYQAFRVDYYGLFGVDPEAARLLARYQEERAKLACTSLMAVLFVAAAASFCALFYFFSRQWLSRGRLTLSYAWFASSVLYLISSWYANDISFMVSSLVSALVALYLRYPIAVSTDDAGVVKINLIDLSSKVVTVVSWVSITLVSIQVLTWVKSGSLIEPDPITLLISSILGDFLHDPSAIKRAIVHWTAGIWALTSLCHLYFLKRGAARTPALDAQLEQLDHVGAVR